MDCSTASSNTSAEALPGVHVLIRILNEEDIKFCFVGELALNYYNVPRVIHDIEICVPDVDLEKAMTTFESKADLFKAAPEPEGNLYTDYKMGFPRYQLLGNHDSYVVFFPDSALHLDPLSQSTVPSEWHTCEARYSKEILDSFLAEDLRLLSFPRLVPFFLGHCTRYCNSKAVDSAMAAEQLVDGMNLDEAWLGAQLPAMTSDEISFATKLVREKTSRMDDFSTNQITCYISDKNEAMKVLEIPGRDAPKLLQDEGKMTRRAFLTWQRCIMRCGPLAD